MDKEIPHIVKESYEHLHKNNASVTMEDLENEIVYFSSYVYLKNLSSIDFTLDYLNQEQIGNLKSGNIEVVDKIIDSAFLLLKSLNYTLEQALQAKETVRWNLEFTEKYYKAIKSYFISKHKIDTTKDDIAKMLSLSVHLMAMYNDLLDKRESISEKEFEHEDICLQTAMYAVKNKFIIPDFDKDKFFTIRDYIIDLVENPQTKLETLDISSRYFSNWITDTSSFIKQKKDTGQTVDPNSTVFFKCSVEIYNCITALIFKEKYGED